MRDWINLVEGALTPWQGDGPLYHGTDIVALTWIIQSNKLTPSIDDRTNGNMGVSLTPYDAIAWGFADRSVYIFDDNHNHGFDFGRTPKTGAIICLNSKAIPNRLVNYIDHITFDEDDEGDEEEIRALGTIENLNSSLSYFSFHPQDIEWYEKFLATDYGQREYGELIVPMRALLHHPKFKSA